MCVSLFCLWQYISLYPILCISFKKLTLVCYLGYILIIENKNQQVFPALFFCILLFTSKRMLLVIYVQSLNVVSACLHTINIFYAALLLKLWDLIMEKDSWSIPHNWFSYSLWTGCWGHLQCCYAQGWEERSPNNLFVCCRLFMKMNFQKKD